MQVTIINATPHAIHILSDKGVLLDAKKRTYSAVAEEVEILLTIEPSGTLPRVASTEVVGESINGVIPTASTTWGEIEGLPPEQEGVTYIVSSLVASAAKELGRKDCLAPLKLVRDRHNGSNVLGCLALGR